jgi:hypothetical protein
MTESEKLGTVPAIIEAAMKIAKAATTPNIQEVGPLLTEALQEAMGPLTQLAALANREIASTPEDDVLTVATQLTNKQLHALDVMALALELFTGLPRIVERPNSVTAQQQLSLAFVMPVLKALARGVVPASTVAPVLGTKVSASGVAMPAGAYTAFMMLFRAICSLRAREANA